MVGKDTCETTTLSFEKAENNIGFHIIFWPLFAVLTIISVNLFTGWFW